MVVEPLVFEHRSGTEPLVYNHKALNSIPGIAAEKEACWGKIFCYWGSVANQSRQHSANWTCGMTPCKEAPYFHRYRY